MMNKFLLLLFFSLLPLLISLNAADDVSKVKADLLRAIHFDERTKVEELLHSRDTVIEQDPMLKNLVEVYFQKKEEELQHTLNEIYLAKEAKKRALEEEQKRVEQIRVEKEAAVLAAKEAEAKAKEAALEAEKLRAAKVLVAKAKQEAKRKAKRAQQKRKARAKKQLAAKVPKKKSTTKTAAKLTKKDFITTASKKGYFLGTWTQVKEDKRVTFELFRNQRFELEERSESGILRLEGFYKREGENLRLDITTITYNVRSRKAAVEKIYQVRSVSPTKMILMDEAGRVVYSLKK